MATKAEGQQVDQDENENEESTKDLDSKINVAVRAQIQRAMKPVTEQLKVLGTLDQTVSAAIAKAMEGREPATPDKKAGKDESAPNPQVKLLQEQIEKLTKNQKDAEERAQKIEAQSKKDRAKALLKTALEDKGIKGPRATALISHFEASGVLQEDEDGKPVLSVLRSRSKGASAEELVFDIREGVEDWAKTAEAEDFLPAPGTGKKDRPVTRSENGGPRRAAPKFDKPPATDDEAVRRTAQQIESRGMDLTAILNGDT